jgi:putative ABC transport system permease protein
MQIVLVIFVVGIVVVAVFALRNRVMLRIALRNIPRRRAQTVLIVIGLMLATLLFSASFATGDTLTHSIRMQALNSIGEIDVVVMSEMPDVSGGLAYFDQSDFEIIREDLVDEVEVDAVAPLIQERAAAVAADSGLNEPGVNVLGYADEYMAGFNELIDEQGNALSLADLAPGQIYISMELADELAVISGDDILLFLGSIPSVLNVAGLYEKGAYPTASAYSEEDIDSTDLSVVMPLSSLQTIVSKDGMINSVIITHIGNSIEGAEYTEVVVTKMETLLDEHGLEGFEVITLKQDALDTAEEAGSSFFTIFFVLSWFSIASGILLIFLIFIMLAAERKRELGIIRAVGSLRGHVIRMFTFEGAVYTVIAAAVGCLLGVVVGWGMVRIMGAMLAGENFELSFAFGWKGVLIAFTLGVVLTFIIVLISSWRVSRLNIVRAIRDIPEPRIERKDVRGLILLILLLFLGFILSVSGYSGAQLAAWMLGTSLLIVGLALLAHRLGLPDRPTFTVAGLGLLVWWLLPFDMMESVLPDMQQGMEMFFLSGIVLVIGGVWVTIFNSDLLIKALVFLFGRIRSVTPMLKTAVSYPMQYRFRTGMILAMFSLVVFTLIMMSFMMHSITALFEDTERISGGFHIQASTSFVNPITDMNDALNNAQDIDPDDFEAIGGVAYAPVLIKQEATNQEFTDFFLQGVDAGYTESITYEFSMIADGYESPREVWQALQDEPGTAIVSGGLVPSKSNYNMGESVPDFMLEGFFIEDDELPEINLIIQNSLGQNELKLRVLAVLEQAVSFGDFGTIRTSQSTVNDVMGQEMNSQVFMFRVSDGVETEEAARALESTFLENGLQALIIEEEIRDVTRISVMFNYLLQGFMGLGLVVGIAALGVIAARSVVERRQQIGILRALGFQSRMVQITFIMESSFIALLGIAIGFILGAALAFNLIDALASDLEGLSFSIPWLNLIVIAVVAYGASLLTTYLPARRAGKIYPAEALRYE